MSNQRKSGKAVTIRVRTIDCLGVIDVCTRAGIDTSTMTFPAIVSKALNIMLTANRKMRIIPDRDGFEWNAMMGQFKSGWQAEKHVSGDVDALIPAALNGTAQPVMRRADMNELEKLKGFRADGMLPPALEERYQELMRLQNETD